MTAAKALDTPHLDAIVRGLNDFAARARERPLGRAEKIRLVHQLAHLRGLITRVLVSSVLVARAADTYASATANFDPTDESAAALADELCRTIAELTNLLSARPLCEHPALAAAS